MAAGKPVNRSSIRAEQAKHGCDCAERDCATRETNHHCLNGRGAVEISSPWRAFGSRLAIVVCRPESAGIVCKLRCSRDHHSPAAGRLSALRFSLAN